MPSEPIMSNDAKSIVITLQLMNRIESEKAIGEKINEDLATEQMNELDLFFDSLENQRKGKNIDDDSKIINTIIDHNSNNAKYDVNQLYSTSYLYTVEIGIDMNHLDASIHTLHSDTTIY